MSPQERDTIHSGQRPPRPPLTPLEKKGEKSSEEPCADENSKGKELVWTHLVARRFKYRGLTACQTFLFRNSYCQFCQITLVNSTPPTSLSGFRLIQKGAANALHVSIVCVSRDVDIQIEVILSFWSSSLVQTCPDSSSLVQTCPDSLIVSTDTSNSSSLVQTCPDSSSLVQLEHVQIVPR